MSNIKLLINQLPDEIINNIFRFVYSDCLNEIKKINGCYICDSIKNKIIGKCKLCNNNLCNICHLQVNNYYRGYQPYVGICFTCRNELRNRAL